MRTFNKDIQFEYLVFFVNFLAMIFLIYLALRNNVAQLFQSLDGANSQEMVRQQFQWGLYSLTGATSNLFQSLGNVYIPINTALVPALVLASWFTHGIIDAPLSYTLFAAEIFTINYLFCRYFKFNSLCALISSWAFVLLAYPLVGIPKIYGILYLIPHISTSIAETLLLMIAMSSISKLHKIRSFFASLFIVFIMMHIFVAYSTYIIESGIFLAFFGFYCLFTAKKNERLFVIFCFVSIALALLLLGVGSFFLGLYTYTAAHFFPSELFASRDWYHISMATYMSVFGYSGCVLVILATLGAFLEVKTQEGFRKNLAIMTLSYEGLLFCTGTIITFFQLWSGILPDIIYFEYVLWPLYIVYATNLLLVLVSSCYPRIYVDRTIPFILSLVVLSYLLVSAALYKKKPYDYPYPPQETPIFKVLRKELALTPDAKFNGRVATFYGQKLEKATWPTIVGYFFVRDYILISFSYYNIPTLFEYNQLLEPLYYKFLQHFLTYPQDTQTRNVFVMRKPNEKILGLLGVRYFVTDAPVKTQGQLVVQDNDPSVYLYKLTKVNVGQYSPTEPVVITEAQKIIEFIGSKAFNPAKQVIVDQSLTEKLVPAESVVIRYGLDGYLHITAHSAGASLIILPFDYSHCLDLFTTDKDVKIVRTDLLLTGVLFKHQLDLRLRYFTGPLHNSSCRLNDAKDARQLGIESF